MPHADSCTHAAKVCDEALKEIGMQMIESRDCALDANPGGEPWWVILTPSWFSLFRLQFTVVGYFFMNILLTLMEVVRLAPKGSGKVRETRRRCINLHAHAQAQHARWQYLLWLSTPATAVRTVPVREMQRPHTYHGCTHSEGARDATPPYLPWLYPL